MKERKDQIQDLRCGLVLPALPDPGARYKSAAQKARVATELWAAENLYCPRCDHDRLSVLPANSQVADFACRGCALQIQLKAKSGRFGRSFVNSAYAPKLQAIRERRLPDYALMTYSMSTWEVVDVALVPGHFISESHVLARRPLASTARRAGWIGSTVRLDLLPQDAFVTLVSESRAMDRASVRASYSRFAFLRHTSASRAGWLTDVLREVRKVAPGPGSTFSLKALYASAGDRLRAMHPENHHAEAKIRQQLQVLRDQGILEFLGRGEYRMSGG